MFGADDMVARKIERLAKVCRKLGVAQILRCADQAQMNMIHHLVPLSGTCSEDGRAVEDFGIEQQPVHVEDDGLQRLGDHWQSFNDPCRICNVSGSTKAECCKRSDLREPR